MRETRLLGLAMGGERHLLGLDQVSSTIGAGTSGAYGQADGSGGESRSRSAGIRPEPGVVTYDRIGAQALENW